MANVEFYKDESERAEWRWRITASDKSIIGKSTEGYSRKVSAENNLRSLPNYARAVDIKAASVAGNDRPPNAHLPLEFYTDDEGKWRWRVTAGNGHIVHASYAGFEKKDTAVANLEGLLYAVGQWIKE